MEISAEITLIAMGYLLLKHMVADFWLQTPFMVNNKGRYGHPGGLAHAGLHVLATVPVLLILPAEQNLALVVLAAEFLVHYHVDWTKEQIGKRMALGPDCAGFWRLMGLDQFAHGVTYVAIVWALGRPLAI